MTDRIRRRWYDLHLVATAALVASLAPALARLSIPRLEALLEPRHPRQALKADDAATATQRVDHAVRVVTRLGRPIVPAH